MKKFFALALALALALSLAACGGGNNDPKPSGNDTPGTSQQEPSNTPDPGTDEPDVTPDDSQPSGEPSTGGWEAPDYPNGEIVYTEYGDDNEIKRLYINNTTIEECQEYCKALESIGFSEMMNYKIHEEPWGEKYIMYAGLHPSSYAEYAVNYSTEVRTVEADGAEVEYVLYIDREG